MNEFEIKQQRAIKVPKFGVEGASWSLIFHVDNVTQQTIHNAFNELMEVAFNGCPQNSKVGIKIGCSDFKHGYILLPFMPKNELSASRLVRLLESTMQSNETCHFSELNIECTRVCV